MTDLEAVKAKWLNICGACDAGIGECSHPVEDYRPVMLELVREIERMRALVGAVEVWGTGFIWHQPDHGDVVIHPAEVTVVVSPGAIAAEKAVVAAARHVRALRRGTMLNPDEVYRALDAAVDALDGA